MTKRFKVPAWSRDHRVRLAILSVLWLGLLVFVAVPTWQGVIRKNTAIRKVEKELATLDQWTVAGLWLAPAVAERTLPVNAAFGRLYPSLRGREALFLDLARVADESGVEEFGLSERGAFGLESNDIWSMPPTGNMGEPGNAGPPTDEPPVDGTAVEAAVTLEVPSVDLASYRVRASFSGDFRRAARFLAGLESIERALKIHSLVVHPDRERIHVEMELDVYVNAETQS